MRTVYLLISLYTGLFLSACSSTSPPSTNTQQAAAKVKDPLTVTVYTPKQHIGTPYVILGKATISEYNLGGIKRQKACIDDAMRSLAATMGGDAVIDLNRQNKTVTGTVIAYHAGGKHKLSPA